MTKSPNYPITNPYVGPRTFTYAERNVFFGREREARDLLARVVSERVLLFYAQSGAGKSSLLQTRLIPQLIEEEGFAVLPVGRVSGELPAGVTDVANIYLFNLMTSLDQSNQAPQHLAQLPLQRFLAKLTSDDGLHWYYASSPVAPDLDFELARIIEDESTLAPYDAAVDDELNALDDEEDTSAGSSGLAGAASANLEQRYVLVIDQFEEILTTHAHRRRDRETFFRQLNQALLDDPNLWVVLTLREDYVAALDPYANLMADKLRARFYMERMGVDAALAAVKQPATLAGRPFADGVAERLVDNLRQIRVVGQTGTQPGQYLEPVQLQVVCYQLWENLQKEGGDLAVSSAVGQPTVTHEPITHADLRASGDVDSALTDFYVQAITAVLRDPKVTVTERQLRDWFTNQLVTTAQTRSTAYRNEETGLTTGLSNGVVDALAARFLLRTELRAGGAWTELIHDRFVQPVLASNRAWLLNQSNPVITAARLWQENGRNTRFLLSGELLNQAQQFVRDDAHIVGELEQEFLDVSERQEAAIQARRSRYIAAIMAIGALLALIGLIFTIRQRTFANATLVASYSILQADENIDTALLLAVEAVKMYNSPETRSQLYYATARSYESEIALLTAHEAEVWGVAYSLDGKWIATASLDGSVILWDAATAQMIRRLRAPAANLSYYRVAFSPDSQWVVAGGYGGYLVVWDVPSGEVVTMPPRQHTDSIFNLAFSPDGKQLATGGSDNRVVLWDVATWQARTLGTHDNWIWDLDFSPDGAILASASRDETIKLWDLSAPASITSTLTLTVQKRNTTSLVFHPSLTRTVLASGDVNGGIVFWDLDPWLQARQQPIYSPRLQKHGNSFVVWALDFTADGKTLGSTTSASTFRYWAFDISQDVTTMDLRPISLFLDGHTATAIDIAFSPDGKQAVIASLDGTASVWEVNSGSLLAANAGFVTTMALIDRDKTLLTATADGTINAWQADSYKLRWQRQLSATAELIHTVFSDDGALLLSATAGGLIQLWEVESGAPVLQVQTMSTATVAALAIAENHRYIAAGQKDGQVSLWQIRDTEVITGGVIGEQGSVESLAFSHDHQMLASGGCSSEEAEISEAIGCPGEVWLWDTRSFMSIGDPLAKGDPDSAAGYAQLGYISSLAFGHDNRKLATGSSRGLVTIWDLDRRIILDENKEHDQERIRAVLFSPDDQLLLSAGPWGTLDDSTGTIIMWDVARGVRFGRSLNEHDDNVSTLLLSQDGKRLYSAGDDTYIVVNNLDIDHLYKRACKIANRNLTFREWEQYMGGRLYRHTCPRW